MDNINNTIKKILEQNDMSIFDLACSLDFDIEEYKEFLQNRMKERAQSVFGTIQNVINQLTSFKLSIAELKIININGFNNASGLQITFWFNKEDYIFTYNLWDMVNNPHMHQDSVTLIPGVHHKTKCLDESIVNSISSIMEIKQDEFNNKIAILDTNTDNSTLNVINLLKHIASLY